MIYTFTTKDPAQTIALGEQIGRRLRGGEVIAYSGGLGVGKTTITRGISLGMGLGDEVTSPTFALVNEYYGDVPLFHFDLYRIESYDDLYAIGFFDYLDRGGIIAAEWSENIAELKGELGDVISVCIEKLSETGRRITVSGKYFGD